MLPLTIDDTDSKKGRKFSASCLAYIRADLAWECGNSENLRPAYLAVAASDAELKAFNANLLTGKKATIGNNFRSHDGVLEIMRSAGYKHFIQKTTYGSVATYYLPSLFLLDPGLVDPAAIRFVCVAPVEWVQSQVFDIEGIRTHLDSLGWKTDALHQDLPLAAWMCAMLDRRCRVPIIPDVKFYLQLLYGCLEARLCTRNASTYHSKFTRDYYVEYGLSDVGLSPGLVFAGSHERLEEVVATQVELYYSNT